MKLKVVVNSRAPPSHATGAAVKPPALVDIHALSPDGVAIGRDTRGRERTVRGAPLGATVKVIGRPDTSILVEVVTPAPDAVLPRCPQSGSCGGCTLQDVPLGRQRAAKHEALAALLGPLGGTDHGIEAPDDDGYGYRNRVELTFGERGWLTAEAQARGDSLAGRFLGFHPPGRFDRVVDAPTCALISPAMNDVLRRARADLLPSPWSFWEPREHVGFWRHLSLREGDEGVLATLYTSPGDATQEAWLRERAPTWGAAGVVWCETEAAADVASGATREVLHGVERLHTRLGDARFHIGPASFFQVNHAGAERLVARVGEALGAGAGGGTLLDLYCGAGAISLALGRRFRRIIGVDANAAAIADARANAADNGIDAEFHAGLCEAVVPGLTLPERPAIVVDPPRAGLHPSALRFVATLDAPVLVYVACRPSSLLRDARGLMLAGWRCTDRWAVDLFPQTGHVEVVARFARD